MTPDDARREAVEALLSAWSNDYVRNDEMRVDLYRLFDAGVAHANEHGECRGKDAENAATIVAGELRAVYFTQPPVDVAVVLGRAYLLGNADGNDYGPNAERLRTTEAALDAAHRKMAVDAQRLQDVWTSIADRLPEDGQAVAFVVYYPGDYSDNRVLGGIFSRPVFDLDAGGFSVPGVCYAASHWMPLPDAPAIPTGSEAAPGAAETSNPPRHTQGDDN